MIYILLLFFSFILTYLIKNYALKKSFLAQVNERSSHTIPTPHGGGIAIATTWFIGLFYLYLTNEIELNLFYALIVGIILSIVSFLDDIFELSAKLRLLMQSFVAITAIIILGGLDIIEFGIFSIENQIITNSFAFFLIIWFINLYNFLDGIDGYAGTEAVFLSMAGFFIYSGNHFLILSVSVLGFLFWNWHKAKIFMGDVGSTLLGYNIAIFTIYYTNVQATNLWVWIILFGLYWFDATFTLLKRFKNKEKLSQAHKKHAYQRLTQVGWSHSKVVLWSTFINVVLFCLVYFIRNIFISFMLTLLLLYLCMKFVNNKKAF